jgi:hypothetical protein
MAANSKICIASRDLALDAALDIANSGYVEIYDGTQPTDADTAITTQNLLVTLDLAATAFAPATNGSKVSNAIAAGVVARSGTASWFRMYRSDGTTVVGDGSVDIASANIILSSVDLSSGVIVSVASLTYSQGP